MKHKKPFVGVFIIISLIVLILLPFGWVNHTAHAAPKYTSLTPQSDKYVDDNGGHNENYQSISIGKGNGVEQGVLGFDLSTITGTVTSAILKLDINWSDFYDPKINIYGSNNDSWSDTDAIVPAKDVTLWTNQTIATYHPSNPNNTKAYSFDVTGFIQSQTDDYATFVLSPVETTLYNYVCFTSENNGYYSCGSHLQINYLEPAATISSTPLNENNIDGNTIDLAMEDTDFADDTLDKSNFTLTGSNAGLSVSGVSYTDATHCTLTLAHDGRDFDSNFSFGVTVSHSELITLDDLAAGNSLPVTAVNDPESISLGYDGSISEGAENGEVISVTLTGGQFSNPINPVNWTLGNLPSGVSKGSVTRVNDHTVEITLSGNAVYDYDVDITNMSVSCTAAEYRDSAGPLTCSTGIRLTAIDNPETLMLSDNGDITENHEDAKYFMATLDGGHFSNTLTRANWSINGQPYGCYLSSVIERVDDHHVRLRIYGLTQVDYDSDITNVVVSCTGAEYGDSSGNGTLSGTGIRFIATNDAESFYTQSYNYQTIYEGQEDGKIIWAIINGGKFPWNINPAHWSFTGLPADVTIGSITHNAWVDITLSGNATQDYDSDRTLSITCSADGYSDSTGVGAITSLNVKFTAINDPESISLTYDGMIAEGAEDGEKITVTLLGGTYAETLNPANWIVDNLPAGVSKGTVTRLDAHTVEILLAGNAQEDYDSDIANISVTCAASEYDDHTGDGPLTCGTSVRFTAENDAEFLSVHNDGLITEGEEDGEVITVTLTGGIFSNPIIEANWTISGLPAGVTKGTATRVDNHHITIQLLGNATDDFDNDITDITVTCTENELTGTFNTSLLASAITINAVKDAESISLTSASVIAEGAEGGRIICVTLVGGQFSDAINPANWTIGGLPSGVLKGNVSRVNDYTVFIQLSGNSNVDYDCDITNMSVTCTSAEYIDSTDGGDLTCDTGITFEAKNDAESFLIADDGLITEGMENGEVITVTLTGGVFSSSVDAANWSLEGQPAGVSLAAVIREDDHTITIRLSGVAEEDYDSDITDMRVTCTASEYHDNSGDGVLCSNTGVRFIAINDAESISIDDDGLIKEGAENGEIITVTLTGGVFSNPLDRKNWTVIGLPVGVTIGNITRIDRHTAAIRLLGNANEDYDTNMYGISVSCTAEEFSGTTSAALAANTGVVLTAVNDPEYLSASALITEGMEDGAGIIVKISGGQFVGKITPEHWTAEHMPGGVSIGKVLRVDDQTVKIILSGNADSNYDQDMINMKISCTADQYVSGSQALTVSEGVVFKAILEVETAPTPTPTASETPGPTVGDRNTAVLTPKLIGKNADTGTITVEIDVDDLPQGTMAIQMQNGEIIYISGSDNMRLELSSEDFDEDGMIQIVVLGDQDVPLGSFSLLIEEDEQITVPDTGNGWNGFISTLLWILIGIVGMGVITYVVFAIVKKNKSQS